MTDEFLEHIFKNSEKAKLIEALTEELQNFDKAIVILIKDKEDSRYSSLEMTLGLDSTYEAYGILEVAKQDLQKEEY